MNDALLQGSVCHRAREQAPLVVGGVLGAAIWT